MNFNLVPKLGLSFLCTSFKIALLLNTLICFSSHSQNRFQKTRVGVLSFKDGSNLFREFTYDGKYQILYVSEDSKNIVYSTFHIKSFLFYDPELDLTRKFVNYEYKSNEYFFELVVLGKVEILRIQRVFNGSEYDLEKRIIDQNLNYDYFTLIEGELIPIQKLKLNKIWNNFPYARKVLKMYLKENNLNFYIIHDKILTIIKLNEILNE